MPHPHSGLLTLAALALAAPGGAARAQDHVTPLELRRLAEWGSGRLRETSGVAVSHRHEGLLWTINDSGDGPYAYLTDTTGALRTAFEVRGARNVDWEEVALGPCAPAPWSGRTCLYIADTGDNDERRGRVALYAVPEPATLPPAGKVGITESVRRLRLAYPDRPRDAEALAVLPSANLALITKGRTGPILRFEIPAAAWENGEFTLTHPDTLPIEPQMLAGSWVTGAATAPDGLHVIVRTYTELYRFRIGEPWTLSGPPCLLGIVEPQGEGIDFLDADRLVLTSERARGLPGGITLVRCAWN